MASGDFLIGFDPPGSRQTATNYATIGYRNQHDTLDFDTTTQETAFWRGVMPTNYAGGNLVVSVYWVAATATTGTIGWDATFERINAAGQDIDSDGYATAQTITAATVDATSGNVTVTSVTCTAGAAGTDSIAAGDLFRLRIRRDVANDTATGDAQLLAVIVKEA
jgi:hypothetical protein